MIQKSIQYDLFKVFHGSSNDCKIMKLVKENLGIIMNAAAI